MSRYLENVWYQAGWSHELGSLNTIVRTILDTPLLLFREPNGSVRALLDRCPHRFAPLSMGAVDSGIVTCGYHGLSFNGDGECVRNPHGRLSKMIRVSAFKVLERHEALWIWMGEQDKADPAQIPELGFIDRAHPASRVMGLLPTNANYQLLVDNIMDLSHADYLHPATLGGMITGCRTNVTEEGRQIRVEYFSANCNAPPSFRALVPPPAKADIWVDVQWFPATIMVVSATAQPAGMGGKPADLSPALHSMTPETSSTTHYFYCVTRNFQVHDDTLSAAQKIMLERAFSSEDKPMIESQQRRIGTADFTTLKPLLLQVDAAAVHVRRRLARLTEAESMAPRGS